MKLQAMGRRTEALEQRDCGSGFLLPLKRDDEIPAFAGLALDDRPLFAIELVGLKPGGSTENCPIHEREWRKLN